MLPATHIAQENLCTSSKIIHYKSGNEKLVVNLDAVFVNAPLPMKMKASKITKLSVDATDSKATLHVKSENRKIKELSISS